MRRRTAALTIGCVLVAGATGCGRSALSKAARSLAGAQGVNEEAVLRAARAQAQTDDEQLRLIQQWQRELPPAPLPPLTRPVDTSVAQLGEHARAALRSAACEAVTDIATTGQIPAPKEFAKAYLGNLAAAGFPAAALLGVANDFTALYNTAAAGNLRWTQVRMTLLKYQYCS